MSKYVIVDLEMCNVPKGCAENRFNWRNELIQIGAVCLDDTFEIEDTFMTYVHPEFGIIDKRIEDLTGITVNDTKYAPVAGKALESFAEWLPDDAVLVSWSDNDENQIRKELEFKQLHIPRLEEHMGDWVDCQKTFGQKMNARKCYKLSEALNIAGIIYEYGEHDALVDAKNTAMLFAKMEKEPELVLSPYYAKTGTVAVCASGNFNDVSANPFAQLLAKYNFAV